MQRERGTDLTIFSPRASFMAHHVGDGGNEPRVVARSATTSSPASAACIRTTSSASASCRSRPACGRSVHRRARALRERARVHRLQPQPGPVGRALEGAAAHRPLVVSALREDGRARRARDGPRQHVVQPELPRHGRALHQRRHDRVHAVPDVRSVQGLPDAEVHHPARRRRGAVPLGTLPRPRAGHEAAAAPGAAAEQRVLRHLRLPPPGDRAADRR